MILIFIIFVLLYSPLGYIFHSPSKTYISLIDDNFKQTHYPSTEFSINDLIIRNLNLKNKVFDFNVGAKKLGLWNFHGKVNQQFSIRMKNDHLQFKSKDYCLLLNDNRYDMGDCDDSSYQFKFIPHEYIESLSYMLHPNTRALSGQFNHFSPEVI